MRGVIVALAALAAVTPAAAQPSAGELIAGGHFKRARAVLEPRVKENPSDAEAAALLSRVRLAFGDIDGAAALAETAIRLDDRLPDGHLQLSRAALQQAQRASLFRALGHAKRAREEAEKAAALDSHRVDARLDLVDYYMHAPSMAGGDRRRAEAIATELARIDAAWGLVAQARIAQAAKRPGDAEPLLRRAIDAAGGADVKYTATAALAGLQIASTPPRYEAAEATGRALVAIDPRRAAGYATVAQALAAGSRWVELDAWLADAERSVPDNFGPYYQAGRLIVVQGGDYARAERYLRKYLTQEPEGGAPTLAHAHWRLGLALEKQGRRADAIAEMRQALRLKPDLDEASKDLRRLQ
jgi:tetratricopeptide (TPR) repeat protein